MTRFGIERDLRIGRVLATAVLSSLVPAPFSAATVNSYLSQDGMFSLKMNTLVFCTVSERDGPITTPLWVSRVVMVMV